MRLALPLAFVELVRAPGRTLLRMLTLSAALALRRTKGAATAPPSTRNVARRVGFRAPAALRRIVIMSSRVRFFRLR